MDVSDSSREAAPAGSEEKGSVEVSQAANDKAALTAILRATNREIAIVEEECTLLAELLTRKKFKTLAEARPVFTKEKRKRKSDGPAPTSSAKKSKPSLTQLASPATAPGSAPPSAVASGVDLVVAANADANSPEPLSSPIAVKLEA